jgi:hypothetical protein
MRSNGPPIILILLQNLGDEVLSIKRWKYTEEQAAVALRPGETGTQAAEVCLI